MDQKEKLYNFARLLVGGLPVRRYHATVTVSSQTVGEHCAGVAALVWWLSEGSASGALMAAAVTHDLPEGKFGDVPSQTKRLFPNGALKEAEDQELDSAGLLFNLSPGERRLLKLADYMEGMLFCCRERALGSRLCDTVYRNFLEYVDQFISSRPIEVETLEAIEKIWESAS